MSSIIDHLIKALRNTSVFNPEIQAAPACILWPDRDRHWEAIIPRLQNELPELLILGDYNPEKKTGPAIWLRCVMAGKMDEVHLSKDETPILYLPGVGRQDLRDVKNCPDYLKPLAELQYRGVIWSQINSKDWTILSFLKSDQGGLGLDVAQDKNTKHAMLRALYRLLDEKIDLLKGKRLDKDYFNTLLTGGDPVRDLLQWIDQDEAFKIGRGENEWRGFVEICKSQLAFNPENEGTLNAAFQLANHEGPWQPIWERFCEAPKRYPNIPAQIRKCKPPNDKIPWLMDESHFDGWPQWNESRENALRTELLSLKSYPPHESRKKITELEKRHSCRRKLVWAELGESPLVLSLEHLAVLADTTKSPLAAGTVEDLSNGYQNFGWRADSAVIKTLSCVSKQEDLVAITTAIRSIYFSWAEESARYLQKIVCQSGYPNDTISANGKSTYQDGECLLFVDGLRFDVAQVLAESLLKKGYQVEKKPAWKPLPSVTATGKPAVAPVRSKIQGQQTNTDFEPCVAEGGQSLKGGYHLKKLLIGDGWEILNRFETGDGNIGRAWCEFGDIDHEGHERGWKLARHINSILSEISDRVEQLLNSGWKVIRILTDHGWLLLPGGLPKIDLPVSLTESKWGRCATIKSGAISEERLYPWYWNPDQSFALADGIGCYRKGEEYAHGGLSLQECLTLELSVTKAISVDKTAQVEFTDITWKGLRCTVKINGQYQGLSLDIRTQPGNSSSSVFVNLIPLKDNGIASAIVENEEFEGHNASIVLINERGELVGQIDTVIGGGNQ